MTQPLPTAQVGNTALQVPRLGMGAAPIGNLYGGVTDAQAIETVQRYPPPAALPGPKFSIGWMRYHIACQYDFITSLVEGRPTSPDFVDGMKVQEVMEAAYISAQEERWVSLPLD